MVVVIVMMLVVMVTDQLKLNNKKCDRFSFVDG